MIHAQRNCQKTEGHLRSCQYGIKHAEESSIPFPASAHLALLILLGPGDFGAGDAKGWVEFARDEIHEQRESEL